ncbi:metallophosphoesterase [Candidatus Woesearchaeota archaeon]|nr:metallophosphoesterase [Candidatus Woesearchaeota archaeon]
MSGGIEMLRGCFAYDLCLYLKKPNILAISDTHIGYEEALNKQGVLIPRFQFRDMLLRLEKAIAQIQRQQHIKSFSTIVINGDLKHEFGRISEQEWRHTLKLIDFLLGYGNELVLVKGNHDTILGPIAGKRKVKIEESHTAGEFLFIHGNKIPDVKALKKVKTAIIGHEHPAVSIREGVRTELFKCFLKGTWKRKHLIVLPSFNPASEGHDLMMELPISPFLGDSVTNFSAYVVADKAYPAIALRSLVKQVY